MVPVSFHDFYSGCATVAGALIGLLFVAVSVAPEKLTGDAASPDHQVRAAAAFSALINTLVIALVALLPTASLGQAGLILAAAGLATTVSLIVVLYREHRSRLRRRDVSTLVILLALYGLQLANAVELDGSPHPATGVSRQGGLCIAFFLFGIARSWQLVGARNLSFMSTAAVLIHRPGSEGQAVTGQSGQPGQPGQPEPPGLPDPGRDGA